jgi:uncharacterized protein YidB (DUF937 family)
VPAGAPAGACAQSEDPTNNKPAIIPSEIFAFIQHHPSSNVVSSPESQMAEGNTTANPVTCALVFLSVSMRLKTSFSTSACNAYTLWTLRTCVLERNIMSVFDSFANLAKGALSGQAGDHAAVASVLLDHLGGVGGVSNLIQTFHQNGAGGLIQQFANGQTGAADPNAIEQAMQGTGIIDGIAQRTGMSPDTVKSSLATVVPLLINHLAANGHVTTDGQPTQNPMPQAGSLVQSLLGKLL